LAVYTLHPIALARTDAGRRVSKELNRRCTDKAIERTPLTKELILNELWDNAQKTAEVKGGSSVRNRALELIGKDFFGMIDAWISQDKPPIGVAILMTRNFVMVLASMAALEADLRRNRRSAFVKIRFAKKRKSGLAM
jgi:ABC-type phosphate transport system auxiliary subunit